MVPNNRWFPMSLQERAAWFDNFYNQFSAVATGLGFVAADVTKVENDNNMVQFLAGITIGVDVYAGAVREYRNGLFEGSVGDPAPVFPANPGYVPPTAVGAGIFERLDQLVKRIRVAPTYTDEIGTLLGIVPQGTSRPAPADMQPVLKATPQPNSLVQVKFTRGATNGIFVESKLDNSDTWSTVGTFGQSPAEFTVPATPGNLPRTVQLRARYVEGNNPVGQYSDIVTTYTQPAG